MPIVHAEVVTIADPSTGKEITIKGLRRRECGKFTVKAGAVSKSFTDYEFSADFTLRGKRYRSVLCRASDFAEKVTYSRESSQWVNPALEYACEKLHTYRKNAEDGVGPVRRSEEKELIEQGRRLKREAMHRRDAIEAQKNIKVTQLVERYDVYVRPKLKAYASAKTHLNRIVQDLGELLLRDLTLERLEEWQSTLALSPKQPRTDKKPKPVELLSPVTVNRYIQTFKAMMTKACDWGVISEKRLHELRKVKLVDERYNRRNDFLSRDEAERLIDCCEPLVRPVVICALQTGMRKDEILSLKWSQVDLTHKLIHMPKTKSGEPRSLPINDRLYVCFKGLTRSITDNHVFTNPETGTRWSDLKKSFRRAVEKAKLDSRGIVFHHLRHTVASWMVMAGIPLLTVAKILGHADIKMVMRYAHLSPQHLGDAVAILDGSLPVQLAREVAA